MDLQAIEKLAGKLVKAKAAEAEVKAERVALENELASMVSTKLEGTDKAEGKKWKVTVTSKLTRSLDYEAYQQVEHELSVPCVDLKPTINLKNLRIIEQVNPSFVASFITTRPAKAMVKIEEVKA